MNTRIALLILSSALAVAVAPPFAAAQDEDQHVVKDENANFEISSPPDSIDWDAPEVPAARKNYVKAYFTSEFVDSDPPAAAYVEVHVVPLSRSDSRMGLDKIAKRWGPTLESMLANPRDRKEGPGTLGGQPSFDIDVKGDYLAGLHRLTYSIARNGKSLYLFFVTRSYDAVDDEQLDEEIQAIRKSFRYLRVEKVTPDRKAKEAAAPPAGAAAEGGGATSKKIDPEKLRKERFTQSFWRFDCLKPEGLLVYPLSENDKKLGVKHYFRNDRNFSRLLLRVWVQTDKSRRYTLEQLVDQRIKEFEKYDKVKQQQKPKIDKKYRFPMAKKAIKLELLGRARVKIHRIWIMADCKNDRQFQLEIYISGSQGYEIWKKQIDEFIKGFKPLKGG